MVVAEGANIDLVDKQDDSSIGEDQANWMLI